MRVGSAAAHLTWQGALSADIEIRSLQFIVTTHSDALVSALTPQAGSVLVSEYLGGTRMRRVEPDSLEEWLEEYRLGDP